MDTDTLNDLKQFISATVSQHTTELKSDISEIRGDITVIRGDITGIKGDIKRLDKKVEDLSDSVAEAIATSNDATDSRLANQESRITKLEHDHA